MVPTRSRPLTRRLAGRLALAGPGLLLLATACGRDGPAAGGPSLPDLLDADPGRSPASCAGVDFAASSPGGRPPTDVGTAAGPGGGWSPPNPDGPTPVDVILFVLAVDRIEALTNSFHFEGYGGFVWCDPRQASGETRRFVGTEATRAFLRSTWGPALLFPTQLGVTETSNEQLVAFPDGTVRLSAKFNARLTASYDFRRFPVDRQTLSIPIQSSLYPSGELVFLARSQNVGFDPAFEIPEWRILDQRRTAGTVATRDGESRYSVFLLEIDIGRKLGFYFWKVLLPVFLIVAVAWSDLWLTREPLGQRQRHAATVLLTIVAFQFVAAGDLPRVSTLTLMDGIMLWSFGAVGVTMITNVRSARLYREDPDSALRYDRRWRWLYPSLYFGGLGLIALVVTATT